MHECPICLKVVSQLKSNSHIIPKWMLADIKVNGRNIKVTSANGSQRSQSDMMGDIVCNECEKIFTKHDTFATSFFRDKIYFVERKNYSSNGEDVYCDFHNEESKKFLYLFVVSVLLRYHLFKIKYESKSLLGSYFEILRACLLSEVLDENKYPIMIYKYEKLKGVHEYPCKTKFDGLNYQRMVLFGYMFYMHLDQRAVPFDIRPFLKQRELAIPVIEGYEAKYFVDLQKLLKK